MSLDETHYDVAVLSTGLPQAIVAAALASAGLSVIHLDRNDYYADQWASLTLSELHRWSSLPPKSRISDVEISFPASGSRSEVPADLATLDRHYALSLAPTLLPATGPSIDTLIASKVSSYATFRLLEHTAVVGPTGPARVPSSKEDVFKSKRLSLIAKRKLMKLLLHVASDTWDVEFTEHPERADTPFVQYLAEVHRFEPDLIDAVAYGVALCTGPSDPTRPALERARAHLQSIGRYGNSAYLVGQYGGAGELAQGYCRAAAVKGAMYILDHQVKRLERTDAGSWQLEIEGIDQQVTADNLVASDEMLQSLLPTPVSTEETQIEDQTDIIRGLLVLDRPIDFETATRDPAASDTNASDAVTNQVTSETDEQPPETGLLVFPPGSLAGSNTHTALALMMGEGTFSCPKGQYVYYLQTEASGGSASAALAPLIDEVVRLASVQQPLVQLVYRERLASENSTVAQVEAGAGAGAYAVGFPPTRTMTRMADRAVEQAEQIYYAVMAQRHGSSAEQLKADAAARAKRRRRNPAEFEGRGGRGADDGVTKEAAKEDSEAPLGFFEKRDDEDEQE